MLGLGEGTDPQELGRLIERHWSEARAAADGRSAAGHLKQAYRGLRKDTGVAFKAIPEGGYGPVNASRTAAGTRDEKRLGSASLMWHEASKSAVEQLKRSAREAAATKQQKWSPDLAANGSVKRWRAARETSMSLLAAQQQGAHEPSTSRAAVAAAAQLRSAGSVRAPSAGAAVAPSANAARAERPLVERPSAAQPTTRRSGR